jgi:hypothetical protein
VLPDAFSFQIGTVNLAMKHHKRIDSSGPVYQLQRSTVSVLKPDF